MLSVVQNSPLKKIAEPDDFTWEFNKIFLKKLTLNLNVQLIESKGRLFNLVYISNFFCYEKQRVKEAK